MSPHDVHPLLGSPPLPRPRQAEQDDVVEHLPADEEARRPARLPWPEPWRSSDGARPRNEYWDVTTASWHSGGAPRH